ncbi:hypothetical protein BC826DRAFT_689819 [Russula brevipes]|nr:hypothetical protein BC826DRAFT_689819 [Russula brevipes]
MLRASRSGNRGTASVSRVFLCAEVHPVCAILGALRDRGQTKRKKAFFHMQNELESTLTAYPSPLLGFRHLHARAHDVIPSSSLLAKTWRTDLPPSCCLLPCSQRMCTAATDRHCSVPLCCDRKKDGFWVILGCVLGGSVKCTNRSMEGAG